MKKIYPSLVSTAYMNEAALCQKVYVLNKGQLLFSGTPDGLAEVARGRCYALESPKKQPTRLLQAQLIDDRDHVVDAVPRGGKVHFILQEGVTGVPYLEKRGIKAEPVPSTLEDGFMILLKKAEEDSLPLSQAGGSLDQEALSSPRNVNIIVKNLVRKFGDFTAVSNTSFEVHEGEIFGLLGPNGAGKTTTFKMLCGLLPATKRFSFCGGRQPAAGPDTGKGPYWVCRAEIFAVSPYELSRKTCSFLGVSMDLALKNWLSGLRLLPMNFTCPIVLTVRLVTSRADISSGFPWLAHSFMNPRSFFSMNRHRESTHLRGAIFGGRSRP